MNSLCYDLQFCVVMEHAKIDCDCVQVEFNKASQSLTDAMVSSVQKKTALNRLVKVVLLHLKLIIFFLSLRFLVFFFFLPS